jgi:hypothetical protein
MVEYWQVKHLIYSPELSDNITISRLVTKQEELAKKMMNLILQSIYVHTLKETLTCCKILRYGVDGFTAPVKEGMPQIFMVLKNP